MTTALRRRLDSLKRLATHPATPDHEAEAAWAAILRIEARTAAAEAKEEGAHAGVPDDGGFVDASQLPMAVGDVYDCNESEGLFARCEGCRSTRFEVVGAQMNGYVGLLVCCRCKRAGRRWLRREHFMPGGRFLQD